MKEEYWLISCLFEPYGSSIKLAINKNPKTWIKDYRNFMGSIILVHSKRISKEYYENFYR